MNKKIDVHILRLNENPNLIEQKVNQLENNTLTIPHVCDGIRGNILQARINAFQQGSSKYVSFVDPDDEFYDFAFKECIDFLENSNFEAVYTNSYMIYNKRTFQMYNHKEWSWQFHKQSIMPVHQLMVIKRNIIEKVLIDLLISSGYNDAKCFEHPLITTYVAKHTPWKFLPNIFGYNWVRGSSSSLHTEKNREQICSLIQTIKPKWL